MQRQIATFPLAPGQCEDYKIKMLNWCSQFSIFIFLDNNEYNSIQGKYECLLGAGTFQTLSNSGDDPLAALQQLHDEQKDWLFGHINYDYKNLLEPKLQSTHIDRLGFPLLHFFAPEIVCHISTDKNSITIESYTTAPEIILEQILNTAVATSAITPLQFKQRTAQQEYLDVIANLRKNIADGDCYEINYCNEGYSENATIDPLTVFQELNKLSPAPFAACYRLEDKYLLCTSPERYLQKIGDTIIAQPIKGTAKRGANHQEDEAIKTALRNNIKEQAENVMIVDLMRNDLARCCEVGSIQVDELFGIYTFPQVHQMISTVSGTIRKELTFTETLRYSFPMGSMTGAPKVKVMELIDRYEKTKRGLFSGTVGYIAPNGDFDFNVVIRSLFYNAATQYLSYQTGGAITYDSVPTQEWEEMRLKAWAMEQIFM